LLLAALTRIDGFIPFFLLFGWRFLNLRSPRWSSLGALVRAFLPAFVVYAAWFFWRFKYYGLLLPSTYYAKSHIPDLMPLRGLEYVSTELRESKLVWVAAAMGVLLWTRRRELVAAIIFVTVHLVYVVMVGGDWMPFGRFILPVVPLMICLVVAGSADLMRMLRTEAIHVRALAALALAGGLVAIWLGLDHRLVNTPSEDGKVGYAADQSSHVAELRKAADLLTLALPPGARLVTDYAGVFGYYTDAYVIDMWGLCTPMIALEGDTEGIKPFFGKTCTRCYPALKPDFFHPGMPIIRAADAFRSTREVIDAVWQSAAIGRHMDLGSLFVVGRVRDQSTGQAAFFLERRRQDGSYSPRSPRPGIVIDYPFV
jgi:hypothetical protein